MSSVQNWRPKPITRSKGIESMKKHPKSIVFDRFDDDLYTNFCQFWLKFLKMFSRGYYTQKYIEFFQKKIDLKIVISVSNTVVNHYEKYSPKFSTICIQIIIESIKKQSILDVFLIDSTNGNTSEPVFPNKCDHSWAVFSKKMWISLQTQYPPPPKYTTLKPVFQKNVNLFSPLNKWEH